MNTTKSIRVDEDIWQQAKVKAAETRLTLQRFTEQALLRELERLTTMRVVPAEWKG